MERCAEKQPDGQSYPFGSRKVAGKGRNQLHQQEQQRNADSEPSDKTQAQPRLNEPKGNARGEPAERGGHRAHFCNRNEDGIAEEQADQSSNSDADDGY